jgi:hypothetical protein
VSPGPPPRSQAPRHTLATGLAAAITKQPRRLRGTRQPAGAAEDPQGPPPPRKEGRKNTEARPSGSDAAGQGKETGRRGQRQQTAPSKAQVWYAAAPAAHHPLPGHHIRRQSRTMHALGESCRQLLGKTHATRKAIGFGRKGSSSKAQGCALPSHASAHMRRLPPRTGERTHHQKPMRNCKSQRPTNLGGHAAKQGPTRRQGFPSLCA